MRATLRNLSAALSRLTFLCPDAAWASVCAAAAALRYTALGFGENGFAAE